jgi:hypothetical protein
MRLPSEIAERFGVNTGDELSEIVMPMRKVKMIAA